jgi:GT2 family glycosyltransferase
MKTVFIIIPVHNRKEKTLACLKRLQEMGSLERYRTVVVDDGSTDGTSASIRANYPNVEILRGRGDLWWTGAIKKGMEYAYREGAEYFLWLNDDCYPCTGAIERLLAQCERDLDCIAGARMIDPDTGRPTYGGFICNQGKIQPIDTLEGERPCDALNGNLLVFSRRIVDKIGYPNSKRYPHYHGDTAYTNLAKKSGFQLRLVNEAIAHARNDHAPVSWVNPDRPILDYWRDYFQIKSPYYWRADLAQHIQLLGVRGGAVYLVDRILRFWSIALLIYPIPLQIRLTLQRLYREKRRQSRNLQ